MTSENVSWLCTSQRCASSSARSTRPWWALSATISCSSPPATGEIGSAMKRGISTSSTTRGDVLVAQPAQPDGHHGGALGDDPSRVGGLGQPLPDPPRRCRPRPGVRGSPARAGSSRRRTPRGSCRTRPSCAAPARCAGSAARSGCRNSAVTANQSAMAPTMLASAPALTKPEEAVLVQGERGRRPRRTPAGRRATPCIRRRRVRRKASASVSGVSSGLVMARETYPRTPEFPARPIHSTGESHPSRAGRGPARPRAGALGCLLGSVRRPRPASSRPPASAGPGPSRRSPRPRRRTSSPRRRASCAGTPSGSALHQPVGDGVDTDITMTLRDLYLARPTLTGADRRAANGMLSRNRVYTDGDGRPRSP